MATYNLIYPEYRTVSEDWVMMQAMDCADNEGYNPPETIEDAMFILADSGYCTFGR